MIEYILDCMGAEGAGRAIQQVQTAHRLTLIDRWRIPAGAKILEVGCGQGDMTAALAAQVGEEGFVHAVDCASPEYGAPLTLGEARERLLASPLGGRLQIDFETNLLADSFHPVGEYDVVVFCHCSWYLSSREELLALLKRTRQLAKRLCFAEWDIRPRLPEQLPHFQAAMLQALCACFDSAPGGNIRTLLPPGELQAAVEEAGWIHTKMESVSSPALQDGGWEVAMTIEDYPGMIKELATMPQKLKELLLTQIKELRGNQENILPLDIVALTAH